MSVNAVDPMAEQALLGAMISSPDKALAPFLSLPPEGYYQVRHQVIAGVLRDMVAKRKPIDPVTVLAETQELGILGSIGGGPYLHSLIAACPTAINAGYYAEWLCELHGRRRLADALVREIQRLDALWDQGERTGAAESVMRLRGVLDDVTAYGACYGQEVVTDLGEFLRREFPHEWIVPGLFERGDRLLLTGDEGFGKSELGTQLACCMAAGIHPFTGRPIPNGPMRVAVIDCENGQGQTQRRYRRMVEAVQSYRSMHKAPDLDWSKQLVIEFRTDGLNLLNAADVTWLERYVTATTPDVLLVGPLYKLHMEDENSALAARAITGTLDGLRARHGCAVITEAHAGHAKDDQGRRLMRPRGSALFLGWPEFGLGLRRSKDDPEGKADVVAWRGHREERAWPQTLFKARSGLLPWLPDADYFDTEGH